MKRLLSVALLSAVVAGCASVPAASPAASDAAAATPAPTAAIGHAGTGWRDWLPATFADIYQTLDARIGMDYGFGANLKFTDLARIGIFDYSEFSLIGVDKRIFYGEYDIPNMKAWENNGAWDLSLKIGVGLGAEASLHTWEIIDALTTLFTANYWSFDGD